MNWILLALILVGIALLIPTAYATFIGAPWAPTRLAAVIKVLDTLGLGSGDVFVDLGAGDGRVVVEAARRGARAIGYELSPIMWAVARLRSLGKKRVSIRLANAFHQNLSSATVIYLFLMPEAMPRVTEMLTKQDLPHLRYVLSYAFAVPGLHVRTTVKIEGAGTMFVHDA